MSRFFSEKYAGLTPYTPGEQPRERKYIKLNTNESPFPPSSAAIEMAAEAAKSLELYSDPQCTSLKDAAAEILGIDKNRIVFTNGSDEALNFAFMAYCDSKHPAYFANITYGFYPVFANLYGIPYHEIPLTPDFKIDIGDYHGLDGAVFIANPNAPTGIILSVDEIETVVKSNPDSVVVVDEAYIDFGGESCIGLTEKYDNLLVIRTFSKSRSLAGARLGFAVGCEALIGDLETIRYSTNPYNVNSMTMAAGIGALLDDDYMKKNCRTIIENREYTTRELEKLGFTLTESMTNFVLARHEKIGGGELYSELKKRGILVRHFDRDLIRDYNRITIGGLDDMKTLIGQIGEIIKEKI